MIYVAHAVVSIRSRVHHPGERSASALFTLTVWFQSAPGFIPRENPAGVSPGCAWVRVSIRSRVHHPGEQGEPARTVPLDRFQSAPGFITRENNDVAQVKNWVSGCFNPLPG